MDAEGLETLLAVTLVAALAPIVVAALPGPKIPQVVVLILAGILIGPNGLDPRLLRDQSGRMAMIGWAVSALLAVGAVAATSSVPSARC